VRPVAVATVERSQSRVKEAQQQSTAENYSERNSAENNSERISHIARRFFCGASKALFTIATALLLRQHCYSCEGVATILQHTARLLQVTPVVGVPQTVSQIMK